MIKRTHRSICYIRFLLVIIIMIITRGKTQLVIEDDSSELPSIDQGIMKAGLFSGLDLKICCLEVGLYYLFTYNYIVVLLLIIFFNEFLSFLGN